MKHQTPDSMKFKKLQRRLGTSKVVTVGTLELLWITTQKNAPRGDIGRFTDEEIAIECEWEGDPEILISALLGSGWIDKSTNHRLIVHDWPSHAPRYVHGIASKKGGFVGDYSSSLQSPTIDADYTDQQPNLTKPNLNIPVRTGTDRPEFSEEFWFEARRHAIALCEACGQSNRRLKDSDRELGFKWGAFTVLYPDIAVHLETCREQIASKVKSRQLERPWGYAKKSLVRIVKEYGLDFDVEWNAISIPPRKESPLTEQEQPCQTQ